MFLGFFDEMAAASFVAPLTDGDHGPISPDAAPVLVLYGADGPLAGTSEGEPAQEGAVTAISTAAPAVVTSAAHGLQTGQAVELVGTTARDGFYLATVLSADTFSLDGTTAGSAQAAVGSWRSAGVWRFDLPTAALPSLAAGSTYTAAVTYAVADAPKIDLHTLYVQ